MGASTPSDLAATTVGRTVVHAVTTKLKVERAKAFMNSWGELMGVIDSKLRVLQMAVG